MATYSDLSNSCSGFEKRNEGAKEGQREASCSSHLKESLSMVDEKTIRLWFVLAVKGIQRKALSLKYKE